MTFTMLGLGVDSSQVTTATPELQKFTAASGQAEAAVDRLRAASLSGAAAQTQATAASKMHAAALQAQGAAARMVLMQQRNMIFQLNDVAVSLASGMSLQMVAMQQGSQILQNGLGNAVRSLTGLATSLVTKFWPIALVVGAVSAAIGGMTSAINETSKVTVNFGDVALATWQVIADGIWQFVKPAVDWLGGKLSAFWQWIAPGLKTAGNGIIATFLGAFDAIKAAWSVLPDVLGDAAISTANNVLGGIQVMVRGAVSLLNDLISLANNIPGVKLDKMDPEAVKFDPLPNANAGAMARAGREAAAAFRGAFGNDYLGTFFGAVSDRAQQNAITRLAEDAEKAGKSAKDVFGDLIGLTNTFADVTRSAFSNLGSGIIDAFKKGGNVAMNVLDMILGKVGQVGEALLNKGLNSLLDIGINALFGGIGGGLGAGAVGRGVYGGMGGFFPAFPGMASGGVVGASGMAWVGERGPELVRLPKGAQVLNNQQSMSAANNNGVPSISITVYGSKSDAAANAEAVRKIIPEAIAKYNANNRRR